MPRPHKGGGMSDATPTQGAGSLMPRPHKRAGEWRHTYIKYLEYNRQVMVFQNRFIVVQYCQLVTCTSGEWMVLHSQTHVANCFTRSVTACCVDQTQLQDTYQPPGQGQDRSCQPTHCHLQHSVYPCGAQGLHTAWHQSPPASHRG